MESHDRVPEADQTAASSAPDGGAGGANATTRRHEVAEFALLGLLRAGPCHGYRLAAAFAPRGWLRPILRLKMSQMYAYLHKLERQGWLCAALEVDETPRPRRVFALTPQGEHAYDAWAAQPVDATRDIRLEFLVKLAFAIELDRVTGTDLVDRQLAAIDSWLARLRAQAERARDAEPLSTRRLIMGYRIRQSEGVLAWLAELRAQLEPAGSPA